jgi:hypothetical protein
MLCFAFGSHAFSRKAHIACGKEKNARDGLSIAGRFRLSGQGRESYLDSSLKLWLSLGAL